MVVAEICILIYTYRATLYSSNTYSSNVVVVVDRGNEKLKLTLLISLGSGDVVEYLFKERNKVGSGNVGVLGSGSRSSRAVEHRAVKLLVRCVKVDKKLKNFVLYLAYSCIGLVYFVENYNNSVVKLKCALKNEAGLGHRSFRRVDEKNYTVYHFENSLNFTAKVRVTWGVDYVYLGILIVNGGVFCKYGNSALTLKVARVHNSGYGFLIFTVDSALFEHFVNKGGLSVVNVSNNCDISKIVAGHRSSPLRFFVIILQFNIISHFSTREKMLNDDFYA